MKSACACIEQIEKIVEDNFVMGVVQTWKHLPKSHKLNLLTELKDMDVATGVTVSRVDVYYTNVELQTRKQIFEMPHNFCPWCGKAYIK